MKIYIGADHNGYQLRNSLLEYLLKARYDVEDEGDTKLDPEDDYPQFASRVAAKVLASNDPNPRGILICGSGQGMCMAANRYKGIRAGIGYDLQSARAIRNDEDSNILCLPSRILSNDQAKIIAEAWLNTPFAAAPRFIRRMKEMDEL